MKKLRLTENELNGIVDFSKKIREKQSKDYSRDFMNKDQSAKRLMHEIIGKVGEYSVTKVIGGKVDFGIWGTSSRGASQFEPDITNCSKNPIKTPYDQYKIHVKTCSLKDYDFNKDCPGKYASWTFDKKDPLISNPSQDDIIILVMADNIGRSLVIGYLFASDMLGKYKPCKVLNHKVALYWPDIKTLPIFFK